MKAIHTKYLGPTITQGARIKAYTSDGLSAFISYPYELDQKHAHFEAVTALVEKHALDWDISSMTYGDSADGRGYCFTFPQSLIKA